ncbi:MAG: ATP-binding protein [Nitrosopumilaceae archaeon]|nr:ATP-binding protein [Nitrosopumilaceae archaeon]
MSIIPDRIEQWNLDIINQLTQLRDIESEDFDFKGTDMKNLANHLCAFANTHGGYLVLGIDEEKNNDKLLRFKKNGFKKEKEDHTKNEIRNHHVRIEPSPEIQTKIIPNNDKFYVVIKIENNQVKKPHFVNEKGCFVRIGPSTNTASRNTVLNLFSDTNKQIQDLENLKASTLNLKEDFILTIDKFRSISPAAPNRLAKLDLTLFRNNITKCQSFLLEKKILGIIHEPRRAPLLSPILHTLDTLNSYIDGFSNTTNPEIKKSLQNQIKEGNRHFVLCQDLESVIPFLDELLDDLAESISKIRA